MTSIHDLNDIEKAKIAKLMDRYVAQSNKISILKKQLIKINKEKELLSIQNKKLIQTTDYKIKLKKANLYFKNMKIKNYHL